MKGVQYCAKKCTDNQADTNLNEILTEVVSRKILSDVQLIQLLSKCDLSIGNIRPFLSSRVEEMQKKIDKNNSIAQKYQLEISKLEADVNTLQKRPLSFQANKCELCKQNLELPADHFFCKHSFHAKCIGDMTHECPR